MAVDAASNTGVAVIGVNNPHLTEAEIDADYRVCTAIPDHPLLAECPDVDDIRSGISYACEVAEAAAAFEEIAGLDLGDLGLLT